MSTITTAQIRALRERLNLTRDEFAFVLAVTTQTIVNWESGTPPNRQMRAILGLIRSAPLKAAKRAVTRQLDKPMSERANEGRLEQLIADVTKR